MPLSRRAFLRDGLRSALSVGLLLACSRVGFGQDPKTPATTTDIPLEAQKDPVFSFAAETFKPYVNGIFTAPNARGEKIELRLVELIPFKSTAKVAKNSVSTDSFTLVFKAAGELPPFTSIHTISHPALGEFDLFLTKRKNDDGDIFYEAVITHFK
jgi:uncharacterized protein DUF6916